MSELTKILSDEHKNILTVIDVLENEAEALKNGKELDNEFKDAKLKILESENSKKVVKG